MECNSESNLDEKQRNSKINCIFQCGYPEDRRCIDIFIKNSAYVSEPNSIISNNFNTSVKDSKDINQIIKITDFSSALHDIDDEFKKRHYHIVEMAKKRYNEYKCLKQGKQKSTVSHDRIKSSSTISSTAVSSQKQNIPQISPSSRIYIVPNENDVLGGRSAGAFEHSGNRKFRAKISQSLEVYEMCQHRKQKTAIMLDLINFFMKSEGSHFLTYDFEAKQWYNGDMQTARIRVATAFRDASIRKNRRIMGTLSKK